MKPDQEKVKSSPIVEMKKADQDWREVPTIVVSGYLSEPPNRTIIPIQWRWKLYRTLALDEYLQFDWKDVVHVENVRVNDNDDDHDDDDHDDDDHDDTEVNPLEPVVIWLGVNARVSIGDFLVGEVADMYMPHADLAASLGSQSQAAAMFVGRSYAGCTRNPGCGERPGGGKI